jgi:hypothetical protein
MAANFGDSAASRQRCRRESGAKTALLQEKTQPRRQDETRGRRQRGFKRSDFRSRKYFGYGSRPAINTLLIQSGDMSS